MSPDNSEPTEPRRPPTFEGSVNLKDFMFQGNDSYPRRSARISKSTDGPTSIIPRPSSPPKRKKGRARDTQEVDQEADPLSPSKPSPKKRKRTASSYAPPSTYAHLPLLPDAITANLIVQFVGLNPGIQTARSGHAYAHPSNLFWKLLFSSGITPRLCSPTEDRQMPELYSLGLTNISIWESIWRVRHGRAITKSQFKYGWQDASENMGVIDGEWEGARVFVATSTSGLAATLSPAEKQRVWSELGSWVKGRRAEREAENEEAS
uniref:Uracil-DNA glycosylase-like domain-containing protein n=1 Tax=Bionectria ochroleuca TaxID=29856 RepID=A0A0B7K5I0_BIOOC